jgi:hypothetical protein
MATYANIPLHMQEGAKRYVERGIPPGSFLTAVLSNNFIEAFRRADEDNTNAMREWAVWLTNDIPAIAHGSPEAVDAWIARGGLAGMEDAA